MREYTKGKRKIVIVDGHEIPFDGKVVIYVDSESGNWVVSSPLPSEIIRDFLAEALEHFSEILEGIEEPLSLPSPGLDKLNGITVMPPPTTEYN